MFQRFNFENLPPERQRELLEKQQKQQQQREMLLQQMETRKKEKEIEKEKEKQQQQRYEQSFAQPNQQQPNQQQPNQQQPNQQQPNQQQPNQQQPNQQQSNQQQPNQQQPNQQQSNQQQSNQQQNIYKTTSKNMSISFDLTRQNAKTQPLNFSPQNPLLSGNGSRLIPQRQLVTMSLTPKTIHYAFASLRHQIMSTAASAVISKRTEVRSSRERKSMTFSEGVTVD